MSRSRIFNPIYPAVSLPDEKEEEGEEEKRGRRLVRKKAPFLSSDFPDVDSSAVDS